MCRECGCGMPEEHGHGDTRTVDVGERVLARNDALAAENRAWLSDRKVIALNFISSPGAGKTLLLEKTLERLNGRVRCAVIAGDQQTDNDARRLSGKGAHVHQIETGNTCHLDASRVGRLLSHVVDDGVRLLFIENVGNLVCPAAFDLGENFKVALLSVTEGEDKPLKYPTLFVNAEVTVLTKVDLVPHLAWDRKTCVENLKAVRPNGRIIELSAQSGKGMDAWIAYLEGLVAQP